jgi:hypothetical protein
MTDRHGNPQSVESAKTLNGAVGADPNTAPYIVDTFTTDITINGTALKGVLSADKETVTYYADTNNSCDG